MIRNAIGLTWESYLFLQEECHRQRSTSGKPMSDTFIARLHTSFDTLKNREGYKFYCDGDLGGCKGSPANAWEERRWTSWSVSDVKTMLDAHNLPYKEGYIREEFSI